MRDDKNFRGWDAVNAHRAWRKALYQDSELRSLAATAVAKPYGVDLRQIAERIADEGINGFNCFPSVESIGKQIGCHARTVQKWRKILIGLGWFKEVTRSGGANHRSLVLNISIPEGEGNVESRLAA